MEHKNHGSPSFINIAVLLLFAVVIAVASSITTYFFLSSRSVEQPAITQSPIVPPMQTNVYPTAPPTTQTTVPTDETVNWKVYRNEKFGFKFSYPSVWKYGSVTSHPDVIFFGKGVAVSPPPPEGPFTPITLVILKGTTVQKEVENFKNNYQYKNFKDAIITVSGVSGRKISGIVQAFNYITGKFSAEAFIPKDDFVIRLSYVEFVEDPDINPAILDQILSTFKFLE